LGYGGLYGRMKKLGGQKGSVGGAEVRSPIGLPWGLTASDKTKCTRGDRKKIAAKPRNQKPSRVSEQPEISSKGQRKSRGKLRRVRGGVTIKRGRCEDLVHTEKPTGMQNTAKTRTRFQSRGKHEEGGGDRGKMIMSC